MIKILLDTNAYSQLYKADNLIQKAILNSKTTLISVITLGELFRGFKIGTKESINIKILSIFIKRENVKVVQITMETAKIYGEISGALKKQGTPLPMNDVWIAACAIETDSTLITYDKHFLKIPGVRVWDRLSD